MSLKEKYNELNSLPPLQESQEVQKYTDEITNFGYDNYKDILQDLYNEIDELKAEIEIDKNNNNYQRIFEEYGDVLFVLGNLANRYNIDSGEALKSSVKEFERRMIYCEEHYNGDLKTANIETMLELWKEAKKNKNN